MTSPRIRYIDTASISDPRMVEEFARARREGTPRPESHAIRAHVPAVFWSFVNTWNDVFKSGIVDVLIKELCRVYVSQSVNCAYCGGQRLAEAASRGVTDAHYKDLLNFERSDLYDERQKAALSLADAITWDRDTDEAFWQRLYTYFSEPELVELGYFIGFTMGQQRFNRLLNIVVEPAPAAAVLPPVSAAVGSQRE
jgi:alkylhydroperoxidase family enzyme